MTMFDASTGTQPEQAPERSQAAPHQAPPEEIPALGTILDTLQDQLDSREIDNTTTVDVPGMPLRLVCEIDFSYAKYAAWQKAALPRNQRNGRKMNPLDMDRAMLAQLVLSKTCVGMQYRNSAEEWITITKPNGAPLLPGDTEFLARFHQVDERVLLRKLFGGEAGVMRAGESVSRAAGWTDEDLDAAGDDPLD